MNADAMLVKPRISEQTYQLAQEKNVYVFNIPVNATKPAVKEAVETQFKVTVTAVNIANSKGKVKKSYQKGRQASSGKRANTKKAYVTVKKGDSIPVYEELN